MELGTYRLAEINKGGGLRQKSAGLATQYLNGDGKWVDMPTSMTPKAHNHAAGNINSGTLDLARLPRIAAGSIYVGAGTSNDISTLAKGSALQALRTNASATALEWYTTQWQYGQYGTSSIKTNAATATGLRSGDEAKPYVYWGALAGQDLKVGGLAGTVQKWMLISPSTVATYAYKWEEYTYNNATANYVFLLLINNSDFIGSDTSPFNICRIIANAGTNYLYSYNTILTVGTPITGNVYPVIVSTGDSTAPYGINYTESVSLYAPLKSSYVGYSGNYSIASGPSSVASGEYSVASGPSSVASGEYSVASHQYSVASGAYSVASGAYSIASGQYSVALGFRSVASSNCSVASGQYSVASGNYSVASGYASVASGQYSVASGRYSVASGQDSVASGYYSIASGQYSVALGFRSVASGSSQTVIGKYNVADTSSAFIIGNGTSASARSNCMTVDFSGNMTLAGSIIATGALTGTSATFTGTLTAGTLNGSGLTASRAVITDASKNLVSSTATATEVGYLSGVTSDVQTQLNTKVTSEYVNARGQNLLTNGTGLLGNNYNFSGLEFDGSEAYNCPGSFKTDISKNVVTSEFMTVNPDLPYKLSAYAKVDLNGGTNTKHYMFVQMYDSDKNVIYPYHVMWRSGTYTELAQDLEVGDTEIYLTSVSGWGDYSYTYQRSIIFWGYANSGGYVYPDLTYSRYWVDDLWTYGSGAIDTVNNKITLSSPWSYSNPNDVNGKWPAGTKLCQSNSGNSYTYIGIVGSYLTEDWAEYAGVCKGVDSSGTNAGGLFRPGTAYVKIGWRCHYQAGQTSSTSNNVMLYLSNITFGIDYLTTIGNAASATKLANSRNFSISGGATASAVSFNGTGDVVLNVTSLNASNLSSGTVPIGRLPTGTTSTTVAFGDHTHSGYALATHNHDDTYLKLSGGTLTGDLSLSASSDLTLGKHAGLNRLAYFDASGKVQSSASILTTSFSKTNHDHDSTYLKLAGGTLTGNLTLGEGACIYKSGWEGNRIPYFVNGEMVTDASITTDLLGLDLSISPTWTGSHVFNAPVRVGAVAETAALDSDYQLCVTRTKTIPNDGTGSGLYMVAKYDSFGGGMTRQGFGLLGQVWAEGDLTHARALDFKVYIPEGGSVTDATAVNANVHVDDGSVGTAIAFDGRVQHSVRSSGSVGTAIGLRLRKLFKAPTVANYGVLQEDDTATNIFEGYCDFRGGTSLGVGSGRVRNFRAMSASGVINHVSGADTLILVGQSGSAVDLELPTSAAQGDVIEFYASATQAFFTCAAEKIWPLNPAYPTPGTSGALTDSWGDGNPYIGTPAHAFALWDGAYWRVWYLNIQY